MRGKNLISLILVSILFSSQVIKASSFKDQLEEQDGVKILHLKGSCYEMGYQHGSLLREECRENLRAFLNFAKYFGYSYDDFLKLWRKAEEYIPQEYREEMQGLADGAGVSFDDVAVGNIIVMLIHCSGFAAWGSATIDGKLYQLRSLDFPMFIKDPITGKSIQENSIIIIREPSNGFASLDPSFAGFIGSLGGINENCIAVEVLSSWSDDEQYNGIPMVFRQRMVLDHAASIEDAIDILTSNRTCGWNFIVSDGKIPIGYAVEVTANYSYVGTWNNTIESTYPFWVIDHVVRRTNIFIDSTTASTQRKRYDPRLFPILSLFININPLSWGMVPSSIPWIHYRALSEGIESKLGMLDLNSSMTVARELYQGKIDRFFSLLVELGFYSTLHQWVACPETGDILISFATRDKDAYENPVHHFNLFSLLK
ncbi:MAG: hypothetical protein DRN12_01025 [Thermoplasmata archaeon]|nr:MAG: hypothetical protein DRN12_01025 [Thermoplasmata archaeon]